MQQSGIDPCLPVYPPEGGQAGATDETYEINRPTV